MVLEVDTSPHNTFEEKQEIKQDLICVYKNKERKINYYEYFNR